MKINIIALFMAVLFLPGCSGCSKSGRMKKTTVGNNSQVPQNTIEKKLPVQKTVIKMEKENGVYKIPVKVNGTDMAFIFDTGAGMISISNVEASYLYKEGKLTNDDVVGQAKFVDANGGISVGTIVKLKEVAIGDRIIYNINASVVNNSVAPLLFGQSALEQFGKISIDYKDGTITFE